MIYRYHTKIAAFMTIALIPAWMPAFAQDPAANTTPTLSVAIDADQNRHSISPLIYGVCFASIEQVAGLNATLNRQGGNNFSRYNWKVNTDNIDSDWYFASIAGWFLGTPGTNFTPGHQPDAFIRDTKAAGAEPMVSVPMIGWVAKVNPDHRTLYSFSVAKYGPQQHIDPEIADAGNGVKPDGTLVTGNDPNDADVPSSVEFEKGWIEHLVQTWGPSSEGGVRYYIMDNEPGLWHSTHRDVHPQGVGSDEYLKDFLGYATMVKSVDAKAQVVAPEEWGWPGFFYSGLDQQYRGANHYQGNPDKDAHGGIEYMPWLLSQIHKHDVQTGKRTLDVFTFHIYPQGGDNNDDTSQKIEMLRNRDTRALWDPNYTDEDWINDKIMLIPRMRRLVDQYYPGTKIGITEYNWGAEKSINGATAQADILGIFGREGLDLATRWTSPDAATPTFKAFQMFRNYDGKKSTFGDESISDKVSDCDTVSSFAALRTADKMLTIMVINKSLDTNHPVSIALGNFSPSSDAQVWQLTESNSIQQLPNTPCADGNITVTLPKQSVTLFVLPGRPK